jgi:hypothetical protein
MRSLEQLERKHGRLPRSPTVLTPSGGQHRYFAAPDGKVRCSVGKLGDGLDVRGEGGYAVAPPSIGLSGNQYKWLHALNGSTPAWPFEAAESDTRPASKVGDVIPEGRRRTEMLKVAGKLKRLGLTGDEIIPTLRALNERCAPPLKETELESVAYHSTITVSPDTAIRTAPTVDPQPIDYVLKTFRHWLHLPDPGVVYVTCAAVAANRVKTFDPTWVTIVGAAGSGKTETLSATKGLDGVHLVATLTEAALLSGTPRKDAASDASGGLLREIGDAGLIVIKDFGSILSMHRDARASVLAALREVYDGNWTRLLGTDGGRRLHWEGRVGLLAGATTVLDQHHTVMAQLGERFLIYRVAIDDPAAQGRSSLAHHGKERGMREELAEAVSALFAGLDLTHPPAITPGDVPRKNASG